MQQWIADVCFLSFFKIIYIIKVNKNYKKIQTEKYKKRGGKCGSGAMWQSNREEKGKEKEKAVFTFIPADNNNFNSLSPSLNDTYSFFYT